jgi:hypothetical protein
LFEQTLGRVDDQRIVDIGEFRDFFFDRLEAVVIGNVVAGGCVRANRFEPVVPSRLSRESQIGGLARAEQRLEQVL